MKPVYIRFSVLLPALILCLITCKAPVNNNSMKSNDTRWIEELTIAQLQKGYKEGKYTVKDVVKVYMDRIN